MKTLSLKATAIGSLPHNNTNEALNLVFDTFAEIPFWPQLAKVNRHEDMTAQYLQGIPGIKYDKKQEKFVCDTQSDEFFCELEEFFMDYEAIVDEKDFTNLEKYAITEPCSSALPIYFEKLKEKKYSYAKCHITGAFTLGTSLCDTENVCVFYDETFREVLIKGLTLKAIWQINKIKNISPEITPIMFMDEPVMSQFGTSAFITVKKEDIVGCLKEISDVIKDFGGLSAVHCCGKSDWSVLVDSGIDIINFDAYAYSKSLCAYVKELSAFLKNGGYIAWGIVPTLDKEALKNATIEELEEKFETAINDFIKKSKGLITQDLLLKQSFFTPSCGAGGLSVELATKAMTMVNDFSKKIIQKYGVN